MGRLAISEERKQRDAFVRTTTMLMAGRGLTKKDLATYMGLSYPTTLERFKNPDTFQFGEMQSIAKLLNVKLQNLIDGRASGE